MDTTIYADNQEYDQVEAYFQRLVLSELLTEPVLRYEQVWGTIMQAQGLQIFENIQSFLNLHIDEDATAHCETEGLSVGDFQHLMLDKLADKKNEMRDFLALLKTGLVEKVIDECVDDFTSVDMYDVLERGLAVAAKEQVA